jgi:hypothetical protein
VKSEKRKVNSKDGTINGVPDFLYIFTKKSGMPHLGKTLIIIGTIVLAVGLILFFAGNKLHWIGRLPGDIRIERENFRFYFPVTTMILLSIVLTALLWLIRKIF